MFSGLLTRLGNHWQARELVLVGVFATTSKLTAILIALASGGMNPLGLIAKNLVFTLLLVILLYKVRKPGTLLLFAVVSALMTLMMLGTNVMLLPPMLLAAAVAEIIAWTFQGWKRNWGVIAIMAIFDLVYKAATLFVSYLMVRESPAVFSVLLPFIVLAYVGSLLGLGAGIGCVKELRHAGIIRS